MNVLMLRLVTF